MEAKITYKREVKVTRREIINEGFTKEFLKDIKSGLKDFLSDLRKDKKQN